MDDVEYLRQLLAESKATEMDARYQVSFEARRANQLTAERDKAETVIRNLQHELDLAHAEIAKLRSV